MDILNFKRNALLLYFFSTFLNQLIAGPKEDIKMSLKRAGLAEKSLKESEELRKSFHSSFWVPEVRLRGEVGPSRMTYDSSLNRDNTNLLSQEYSVSARQMLWSFGSVENAKKSEQYRLLAARYSSASKINSYLYKGLKAILRYQNSRNRDELNDQIVKYFGFSYKYIKKRLEISLPASVKKFNLNTPHSRNFYLAKSRLHHQVARARQTEMPKLYLELGYDLDNNVRTATGTITEAYAKVGIDWRFSVNFKENSLVDAESKNVDSLKTIKKSENEIRERYIKYMIRSYLDKKGDSSRRSMIALDIAYALEILNENFIDRYIKFK